MKLLTGLAAAGFLAFAPPALAAGPAPAPASAASPAVEPERLALANQLLDTMHVEKMMKDVSAGMLKSMQLGDDTDAAQQLRASLQVGFEAITPDMRRTMAVVYAETFTAQELRDVTAFYGSPSGQSMLAKMPQATSRAIGQIWPLMPKMVDAMQADFCSHAKCGERESKMFDTMRAVYARMGRQANSN
jgi:hypothetical protein